MPNDRSSRPQRPHLRDGTRFGESLDYVLDEAHEILATVDPDRLERSLELLEDATRVFVYGAGRSGLVAKAFAIRLMHLGYQTFVIGETITAPVQKGDVVILISGSGETYPVVMTAEIARNIGASLISITQTPESSIARYADVVLMLHSKRQDEEKERLAPLGTLFESSVWLLLDGVVADLMARLGQTEVAMRKRHATLE